MRYEGGQGTDRPEDQPPGRDFCLAYSMHQHPLGDYTCAPEGCDFTARIVLPDDPFLDRIEETPTRHIIPLPNDNEIDKVIIVNPMRLLDQDICLRKTLLGPGANDRPPTEPLLPFEEPPYGTTWR